MKSFTIAAQLRNLGLATTLLRMWDSDDDAAVLSDVFKQTASMATDTLYSPYDKVWKHFFTEQASERRQKAATATPAPSVPSG
jgi:hypothetical protein